jgi:hypothetical protein
MITVTYFLIIDSLQVGQVEIVAESLEQADLFAKRMYQPSIFLMRDLIF